MRAERGGSWAGADAPRREDAAVAITARRSCQSALQATAGGPARGSTCVAKKTSPTAAANLL
jgi:hypothetical protein